MFGKIGTTELILILVVALLIFGPSKLPAIGKMVGEGVGKMRRYANSDNWDEFLDDEEAPKKKSAAKKEEPAAPAAEEAPAEEESAPAESTEAAPPAEESAEQIS